MSHQWPHQPRPLVKKYRRDFFTRGRYVFTAQSFLQTDCETLGVPGGATTGVTPGATLGATTTNLSRTDYQIVKRQVRQVSPIKE